MDVTSGGQRWWPLTSVFALLFTPAFAMSLSASSPIIRVWWVPSGPVVLVAPCRMISYVGY